MCNIKFIHLKYQVVCTPMYAKKEDTHFLKSRTTLKIFHDFNNKIKLYYNYGISYFMTLFYLDVHWALPSDLALKPVTENILNKKKPEFKGETFGKI